MIQKKTGHYVIGDNYQMLTDFYNFCTIRKQIKFSAKPVQYLAPPHLNSRPTLLWNFFLKIMAPSFTNHNVCTVVCMYVL